MFSKVTAEQRTNKVGKVAAVLDNDDGRIVVISRGEREGVKWGDLYGIRHPAGHIAAVLRVCEVQEKMAQAQPVWVSKGCPVVTIGLSLFLLEASVV